MRRNTTITHDGVDYEVEYDIDINIRKIKAPDTDPDDIGACPAWDEITDELHELHDMD